MNALAKARTFLGVIFSVTTDQSEVSFVKARDGLLMHRSGQPYGHVYKVLVSLVKDGLDIKVSQISLSVQDANILLSHHSGCIEIIQMLHDEITYHCGDQA